MADETNETGFFSGAGDEPVGNDGAGNAPAQTEPASGQVDPNSIPSSTESITPSMGAKLGDFLPEEYKSDKIIERQLDKTLKEYIDDGIELRKKMGGMVSLPPNNADDAAKREYLYGVMDRLGMAKPPSTPLEYEFTMNNLPEGQTEPDAVMLDFARNTFYKAGLTNEQANKIISEWNASASENIKKTYEKQIQDYENAKATLQKEWGETFDSRHRAVVETAHKLFSPDTIKELEASGIANNPRFLRELDLINKQYFKEHSAAPMNESQGGSTADLLTNKQRMRKILVDPNFNNDVSLQQEFSRLAEIVSRTEQKLVR